MRLGLASLLVALSSLLAPPPHSFALAITPPDDFTESSEEVVDIPNPNHLRPQKLSKCIWCGWEENDLHRNTRGDAALSNYGIGGSRPKLTARDLKTEDMNYTRLTLGYLTAVRGDLKERQGLQISGAIKMALDEVSVYPNLGTKTKRSAYL